MATLLNHYQLLGLSEKRNGQAISSDELRQAYKRALLAHHPDKKGTSMPVTSTAVATVDEIAEAYRVLGDAISRAQYDQVLRKTDDSCSDGSHTRHTGMETVDLEELSEDEDSAVWRRPCRCGSEPAFVVTEAELEKNVEYGELITGCKGCSLWLKVMFTVDD
ncbi:putative diphthamide biosynthesis protein 3/4 [Septoria linicola]|nr:putative diphthamide biosynthesis protein 3/4 [Septoria linicola]